MKGLKNNKLYGLIGKNIDYSFSKNADKYNFDTKLDINNTLVKIDFLNYKKK